MNHLRDDFKSGQPISSVGADWFNGVAKFINNICGGLGITIHKDGDTPTVEFDPSTPLGYPRLLPNAVQQSGGVGDDAATVASRHPKDVATIPAEETAEQKQTREMADIGTANWAARSDHTHRFSCDMGEAEEHGEFPTDEVEQTEEVLWTSGGDDGAKLLVLYQCDSQGVGVEHELKAARLYFTKDGFLHKIEAAENSGIDLMA